VAVYAFVGQYATDWGLVFAGLVLAAIPVLTAYLFLQRHLIAGFAGGIKG
jgi:raffinose/stachyose/melibiose transport system permease protein